MKNLFLFLSLIALPFAATAQVQVVTDTIYITQTAGKFFQTKSTTYEDGSSQTSTVLLGDSTQTLSFFANSLVSQASQISSAAVVYMDVNKTAKQLNQIDAAVTALVGSSPQKAIQNSIKAPFLSGSWSLSDAGVSKAVTFAENASGLLRYTVAGSTAKTVSVLGSAWVVLKNYPTTGVDTNLFQLSTKRWATVDKSIILSK
jgi:hypothetical protein